MPSRKIGIEDDNSEFWILRFSNMISTSGTTMFIIILTIVTSIFEFLIGNYMCMPMSV